MTTKVFSPTRSPASANIKIALSLSSPFFLPPTTTPTRQFSQHHVLAYAFCVCKSSFNCCCCDIVVSRLKLYASYKSWSRVGVRVGCASGVRRSATEIFLPLSVSKVFSYCLSWPASLVSGSLLTYLGRRGLLLLTHTQPRLKSLQISERRCFSSITLAI